jgi:probable HAF family extracellular repeat protein
MVGLGDGSYANSVSGDGKIVVGYKTKTNGRLKAFRWTSGGGMVDLGALDSNANSNAQGVSRDGSTVVGFSSISSNSGVFADAKAFRWTAKEGIKELKELLAYEPSPKPTMPPPDVQRKASLLLVPTTTLPSPLTAQAIDEIPPLGLGNIPLRSPNPKKIPSENACNGKIVVGYKTKTNGRLKAFRWTSGGGMVDFAFVQIKAS